MCGQVDREGEQSERRVGMSVLYIGFTDGGQHSVHME